MTPVFLGLGANLGDPEATLRRAIEALAAELGPPCAAPLCVAPLWRSAPLLDVALAEVAQPDFSNTVVLAQVEAGAGGPVALARRLLALGKELERRAGRPAAGPRWGPRTLDVDVLLVGALVHADAELVVPHPELRRRAFVLRPLAALAPELRLPPDGAPVTELLAAVSDQRLVEVGWSGRPPGSR